MSLLELAGVSKSYGAVKALSGVSFAVRRGEVHAILGENGAGKSTTLKIINGEVTPDEGEVRFAGDADVAMVHQELAVFPNMSVAENIFVSAMPRKGGRIDFHRMHARSAELLALFGLQIDTRQILSHLTPGQQQIVEILRAVQSDAGLLILDEPTSGLNNREAEVLLALVKRLRDGGHTILYVSHRLHEVLDIADQITVLRDGRFIDTLANEGLTEDDLIRRMVGRDLGATVAGTSTIGPVALSVKGYGTSGHFAGMDLDVHEGEIVGVFGLEGSGAEEFSQALFGLTPATEGRLWLKGAEVRNPAPAALMQRGMSYLNGNRKDAGLYMDRSIADNISAPVLDRMSRRGLVDARKVTARAEDDIRRFAIRVPGWQGLPKQLSGGNQQKVMFSACLANEPDVIVLNEPTRGVDVGAKAEVHDVARHQAGMGKAVVVFSSDLPELLRLSHRIVVMRGRRPAGEVSGPAMTEEAIMALAAGGK